MEEFHHTGKTPDHLKRDAIVALTERPYVWCSHCNRIIAAYSHKTLTAYSHRLDLSPGYRGIDPSYPDEELVEVNTDCPGSLFPGELIPKEYEIYQSPWDTLSWYRLQ